MLLVFHGDRADAIVRLRHRSLRRGDNRIVLLRGIRSVLGDSTLAIAAAVLLQAIIFGLVHLYQGPAGVAGATLSGLVYGTITVMARGAIWPAAMAHGFNNTIGLVMIYSGVDS